MTHADIALMLVAAIVLSIACVLAVTALDWLQRQRMPRPPSDAPAFLRKAKL